MSESKFDACKDKTWQVQVDEKGVPSQIEGNILCVLQDIRRELKTLNDTVKKTRFMAYAHDETER